MGEWRIELVERRHERNAFDCGQSDLNEYIKKYARQNTQAGVTRTYVACPVKTKRVAGFYSLSTASMAFEHLPPEANKGLPKYPIPTVHLARLAVDKVYQKQGLGGLLLFNAMFRTAEVSSQAGVFALTVDAKDTAAKEFYLHYGFEPLADSDRHLYLPMRTVREVATE